MATPYNAPLPPDCALDYGCEIEFVALDPATGNAVSGVMVSNASIYVASSDSATDLSSGPFMFVPGPSA